ncbi:tRNA (N6-threonylcarbamoyladenosine(37)-N6)-methyltransferase TrmO [Allohahella marinimesophila]|uniref:tRNA (N6-threonylcarbamoyladenosine(37)-N6)-methyltransferase TrmO n=1 Tax=Allohahella marinimesophila TaxID=1054972 RepID=A0ABP7PZ09_9GAMM
MSQNHAEPGSYEIHPIAWVRSPFTQKFGVPRQAGLAAVPVDIVFEPAYSRPEAFVGLNEASHLWVIGRFHLASADGDTPSLSVRPPRLGGNRRMGVFATRSSFRPNGLSLSAVRLLSMESKAGHMHLTVEGLDLVDGSPIFDVKPYLPYADALPEAELAWAEQSPQRLAVDLAPGLGKEFDAIEQQRPGFLEQLCSVLELDPRPAYHARRGTRGNSGRSYTIQFGDYDVSWAVEADGSLLIHSVRQLQPNQE